MTIALIIFVLSVLLFASRRVLLRLAVVTLVVAGVGVGGFLWFISEHNAAAIQQHAERASARQAFFDRCDEIRKHPSTDPDAPPSVTILAMHCENPASWAPTEEAAIPNQEAQCAEYRQHRPVHPSFGDRVGLVGCGLKE